MFNYSVIYKCNVEFLAEFFKRYFLLLISATSFGFIMQRDYINWLREYNCVIVCFRFFPVGPDITRIPLKDIVIGGYRIPAGVRWSRYRRYMNCIHMHIHTCIYYNKLYNKNSYIRINLDNFTAHASAPAFWTEIDRRALTDTKKSYIVHTSTTITKIIMKLLTIDDNSGQGHELKISNCYWKGS